MDGDAAGPGYKAGDAIAGNGIAAAGNVDEQVAHAQHRDAGAGTGQRQPDLALRRFRLRADGLGKAMGQLPLGKVAGAQADQKILHIVRLDQGQNFPLRQAHIEPAQFLAELFPAALDVAAPGLMIEPLADFLPGAGRLDIAQVGIEPIGVGAAPRFGGHYFHRVPVLQGGVQADQPAVHLAANAAVAQFGVDFVGKVNGRGAGGQLHNVALGGIDEYLVVEQILLDRLDELVGAGRLPLPLQQLAHPGHLFLKTQVFVGSPALFVAPMGGHPILGDLVHFVGFYLHFQRLPPLAEHGGVQSLVHIFFGIGYIVVKLAGNGTPQLMNDAQSPVAIPLGIHHDPQGVEVENIPQFLALVGVFPHFVINAVNALGPAVDLASQLGLGQKLPQGGANLLDIFLPLGPPHRQHPGNFPIAFLVQMAKSQIVQLPLDFPDAQAVRQRRIDVQGFLGNGLALVRGQGVQGFHIVQAVGQFNQHHPDVLGHGHQHFAEAFGVEAVGVFRGMAAVGVAAGQAVIVHPGQLGNAVHQFGYFRAEPAAQVGHGNAAILDHIVEQRPADGMAVQVQVGQKGGGGQGMGNVRLAGFAVLPAMATVGVGISLFHQLRRLRGQIAGYLGKKGLGVLRFYPILHNSDFAGCIKV